MKSNHWLETRKTGIVNEAKWLICVLILFAEGLSSSVFAETTERMLIMAPLNPDFVRQVPSTAPLSPDFLQQVPDTALPNPDFVQQELSPGTQSTTTGTGMGHLSSPVDRSQMTGLSPSTQSTSTGKGMGHLSSPVDRSQMTGLSPSTQPTSVGRGMGHLHSPVDRSHMVGLMPEMKSMMGFISGVYPASFDLRTSGDVTSVKNQGNCGSCWAFGAIASVESTTLMGGGSTYDFSENHMNVRHGFDPLPCAGGNSDIAGAYMTRWGSTNSLAAGLVFEADDPYTQNAMYGTPPYTSVAGLLPRVHVQEFLFLPDRGNKTENDNYKYALQNYGAVDVSINWNDAYWDQATNSYYYSGTNPTNHDVALVGWDDNYPASNFSTMPSGNGAFIAKNSWGTGFGSGGYFYISYYDSQLSDATVFRKPESINNYMRSYLYDPFGQTDSVGYSSNSAWGANVYTAVANEQLQAVAFYTLTVNSSYEVYIYTGVTGSPTTGVLEGGAVNTIGSFPYAGYHTLALERPVSLMAGQKFAVVVKFTTPGYIYPVPIEYPFQGFDSAASASTGQSYVSYDGSSWADITSYFLNTNVNIRAFIEPVSYLLTVAKSGTGVGTVTSNPIGINCGTNCSEDYTSDTNVTLTAMPADGSIFAGWSGACTGTIPSCVISMTAAKTVTANFNAQITLYPLTLTNIGQGTVTSNPEGINCGIECSEEYTSGTSVTLTATPAAGYAFGGWSGACSGTGACEVAMISAKSVTATFNPIQNNNTGGGATGLTGAKVSCTNLSTQQVISATVINNSWDCAASGLSINSGNRITMTIKGTAP